MSLVSERTTRDARAGCVALQLQTSGGSGLALVFSQRSIVKPLITRSSVDVDTVRSCNAVHRVLFGEAECRVLVLLEPFGPSLSALGFGSKARELGVTPTRFLVHPSFLGTAPALGSKIRHRVMNMLIRCQ